MTNFKEYFSTQLMMEGVYDVCFAFSIHKAGSTLMHKMIGEACNKAGISGVTIPDTLFREGLFEKDWENDENILKLISPGHIYYGFRALPPILEKNNQLLVGKKAVLLVRDPRDALVSQFFSFGGKHMSHKMPEKNKETFIEKAQSTAHLDIDAYVIESARNHRNKLEKYRENLDFKNLKLFRYEDVFFDKQKFLTEIFEHFRISIDGEIIRQVAELNDIRPTSEDISKHIRKGTPGDYLLKLKQETIRKLNEMLKDTCEFYGYTLK